MAAATLAARASAESPMMAALSGVDRLPVDIRLFAEDYPGARERFCAACESLPDIALRAVKCPASGPGGEVLHTDVAWLGDPAAGNVLLVMSGTHGVEGFAGSAVQSSFLQALPPLPENTAILMVHLLNPWGAAWLRRCDHEGVDLNRNVVDFTAPLPHNGGYTELRDALFAGPTECRAVLAAYAQRHGQSALEFAVSGGQYADAAGPFYGGTQPSHARRLLENLIAEHGLAGRRLAVIDIHTGLGPFGHGELICDHEPDSPATAAARRWYGGGVALPLAGTSFSVPKLGLIDFAFHPFMREDGCFITLEFGSYAMQELLAVIIDDHRRWMAGDRGASGRAPMRHHFCPDDRSWREMVLWRGQQVLRQALAGLGADALAQRSG